jgi:hypothetical protein
MASVRLLTGGTGTDYLISAPPDAPFSQNLMLAAGNYELQGELSDYQSYDMQGGSHDTASFNLNLEVVPEPISMVMLGCLGVGMAAARKLRRKRA